MNFEQAKEKVFMELSKQSINSGIVLTILEEETIEFKYGWFFFISLKNI